MALFPKRINLDDASIAQLALLFTVATNDLQKYLFTLNGRALSRSQIMTVRAQATQRLQTLGTETGKWIAENVPAQYAQGQQAAAAQLAHFGESAAAAAIAAGVVTVGARVTKPSANQTDITITIDEGVVGSTTTTSVTKPLNVVGDAAIEKPLLIPNAEFYELHTESVQAIMDDMSTSFGTSLTTIARTTNNVISKIQALNIRRTIAESAKNGSSVDAISKQIADLLTDNDIAGLVDKAGRVWAPDVYARMLTRTKLAEAQNNGLMNALVSAGHDLVQVSSHGAMDSCGPWEGEILSISGSDSLYKSVADARGSGTHIFGPNCKHVLQAVDESILPTHKS